MRLCSNLSIDRSIKNWVGFKEKYDSSDDSDKICYYGFSGLVEVNGIHTSYII